MKGVFEPKAKAKRLLKIYGLKGSILISDAKIRNLVKDRTKLTENKEGSKSHRYREISNLIRNWKLIKTNLMNT